MDRQATNFILFGSLALGAGFLLGAFKIPSKKRALGAPDVITKEMTQEEATKIAQNIALVDVASKPPETVKRWAIERKKLIQKLWDNGYKYVASGMGWGKAVKTQEQSHYRTV